MNLGSTIVTLTVDQWVKQLVNELQLRSNDNGIDYEDYAEDLSVDVTETEKMHKVDECNNDYDSALGVNY